MAKTLVYYLPDDDTFILITREGPNLIMETGDIKTALVSLSPRKNTNRSFIGIEKDENYFKIAEQRINERTLFS